MALWLRQHGKYEAKRVPHPIHIGKDIFIAGCPSATLKNGT
jgi:hypothetical protein